MSDRKTTRIIVRNILGFIGLIASLITIYQFVNVKHGSSGQIRVNPDKTTPDTVHSIINNVSITPRIDSAKCDKEIKNKQPYKEKTIDDEIVTVTIHGEGRATGKLDSIDTWNAAKRKAEDDLLRKISPEDRAGIIKHIKTDSLHSKVRNENRGWEAEVVVYTTYPK